MRIEATLEQWKSLYETATRIKELKPWEKLWDIDLIGISRGDEENMVFYSILGRGEGCCGIAIYEGLEGLNSFMLLASQKSMNVSSEYAIFNQKSLNCYWGNREELTDDQQRVITELGYTYRGKNQWLYFLSFKPGYYPYTPDGEEVLRMGEYMLDLEQALKCYDEEKVQADFESGNMFYVALKEDKEIDSYGERKLPFTTFRFGNLLTTDEGLLSKLAQVSKCDRVLEADISALGAPVTDEKYARPANPALLLLGDANTGAIIRFEFSEPEDNPIVRLAELLIGFILEYGAPTEIKVTNVIVEAGLEQICNACGIKLCRVKSLQGLDDFKSSMHSLGL